MTRLINYVPEKIFSVIVTLLINVFKIIKLDILFVR